MGNRKLRLVRGIELTTEQDMWQPSKPVAYISRSVLNELQHGNRILGRIWRDGCESDSCAPIYSQEYVSALIQRAERLDSMLTESVQALKETEQKIAELEQAMHHIHGALLDITVPRSAIAKAAELAVEHANMKEQSNG
ncbi:TPA: hypothetical protein ACKQDI_003663 [Serratia marcescens]